MINDKAVCELLALIEQEIDVYRYDFMGQAVWPLLRNHLAWAIRDSSLDGTTTPEADALSRTINSRFLDRWPGWREPDLDTHQQSDALPDLGHGNAVFLTRADEHNLETPEGFAAPLADTWQSLQARHCTAIKLENIDDRTAATMPRRQETLLLYPRSPSDKAKAPDLNDSHFAQPKSLIIEVIGYLQNNFGLVPQNAALTFIGSLHFIATEMLYYRSALEPLNAKIAYFTCHYCHHTPGFLWACRELGIRTVELQHGYFGPYHFGYTHWPELTRDKATFFPDVLLSWGSSTLSEVRHWATRSGPAAPQMVIGGRPDLDRLGEMFQGTDVAAALQQQKGDHKKTILLTLSHTVNTNLVPALVDLIKASPKSWLWWVRCHPLANRCKPEAAGRSTVEGVSKILSAEGVTNAEVQLSTTAPLSLLLSMSDHHITHFSSSVLEALGMGVPSTCVHPLAKDYWAPAIRAGVIHYAETPEAILATVTAGNSGLNAAAADRFIAKPDPDSVIGQLWGKETARQSGPTET